MSSHAADLLQTAIERSGSIACVGLDPRPALLPPTVVAEARARASGAGPAATVALAFTIFNQGLLESINTHCACVKPQVACYEAYGAPGLAALEITIARARELGIPVIVDGKRGDIGSTASHYRQAWLDAPPDLDGQPVRNPGRGDWLTVNPYMGSDTLQTFLGPVPGEGGLFVLVKTSNPGSAEVQGLDLAQGGSVMEAVAGLVARLGSGRLGRCGLADVGAVVGATYPDEARQLRALMPEQFFLVPGYGAQGGSAADALAGLRHDGRGLVVNSSRAILAAWQDGEDTDWAGAARAALEAMNADLARHR